VTRVPYEMVEGGAEEAVASVQNSRTSARREGWAQYLGAEPRDGRVLAVFLDDRVDLWWSAAVPQAQR
jgi:hypothetical protein